MLFAPGKYRGSYHYKDVKNDLKRKLLALLLSGLAIILLMGAGDPAVLAAEVEAVADSIRTEEPVAPVEEPVDLIETQEGTENAQEVEVIPEQPAQELDRILLVDGQPVPKTAARTTIGGMTYVSLKVMSQQLDTTAQVSWDGQTNTITVTTQALTLTAKVGQKYLVANGRYLYMPKGVIMSQSDQAMVSLDALVKAFDANLGWDGEAGTFVVTRGSGAIESADTYYREEDLFWLSRVIYAESGNQVLEGKMGVGIVVLNRVNDRSGIWPDSVKGVISQRNQFSTYKNGKLANRTPNAESVVAAKLVLDGGVVEEVKDAFFFDTFRSNSWAARNKSVLGAIGGHRFYG